jgi:hypothetical protein
MALPPLLQGAVFGVWLLRYLHLQLHAQCPAYFYHRKNINKNN